MTALLRTRRIVLASMAGACVLAAAVGIVAAAGADSDTMLFTGVFVAHHTKTPVQVDGVLDDAVWRSAPAYHLSKAQSDTAGPERLAEQGAVKLAWDDQYLYVAVKFEDSDVVAEGKEDQLHHFRLGDVVELFLKPERQTWYWELYATPAGRKTSYWYPGRGRLGLPSAFETYTCGLRVAAKCQGTLNRWQDKDTSWTAEMAVPIKDLTAFGDKFAPGAAWRILVARYNYSRYLPWKELSTAPQLAEPNNHLHRQYANLVLRR